MTRERPINWLEKCKKFDGWLCVEVYVVLWQMADWMPLGCWLTVRFGAPLSDTHCLTALCRGLPGESD